MNSKYVIGGLILVIILIIIAIFINRRKEKFNIFDDIGSGIESVGEAIGSGIESAGEDVGSGIESAADFAKSAAETSMNAIEGVGIKIGDSIVSASDYVASGVTDTADIVKNDVTDAYYTTVNGVDIAVNAVANETLSGVKFLTAAGNAAFQQIDATAYDVAGTITNTIDNSVIPLINSSWSVIKNDLGTAISFANNTVASVASLENHLVTLAIDISPAILSGLKLVANIIIETGELILAGLEAALCQLLVTFAQQAVVALFEVGGEAEAALAPIGVMAGALRVAEKLAKKAVEDVLGNLCDTFSGFVVGILWGVLSQSGQSQSTLTRMIGFALTSVILSSLEEVSMTAGQCLIAIIMSFITNLVCTGTLPGGYPLFNSPLANLNSTPSSTTYPTTAADLSSSLALIYKNQTPIIGLRHISGTPSEMYTNQYMRLGDQLVSSSGLYALKFLTNGVIAVYDAVTSPQAFIYTLDINPLNVYLGLIGNGDLVTLDSNMNIIKTLVVNTMSFTLVSLTMQSDGNVVLCNESNTALSLWNSTGALPVVFKNYLCSINGNYLMLINGVQLLSTTNVANATPVYIDTWVYSPTITVYPVKTANQQFYINGDNNITSYSATNIGMILYSKTSPTYINTVASYNWLADLTPPYFNSITLNSQGTSDIISDITSDMLIWNIIPNIAQLTSTAQINWFNTPGQNNTFGPGIIWMQSLEGQMAMTNPTLSSGLVNTSAWITGYAGEWWINSTAGQNWLLSLTGQLWLNSSSGQNWLVSLTGQNWLVSLNGQNWLTHNKGTTLYAGQFLLVGDFLEFKDTDNTVYTAKLGGPLNRLVITGTGMPPRDLPIGYNINSNVGNMLIMQPDGNLVILDAQRQPCWATTDQAPNSNILPNPNDLNTRAVLGPQGNLAVYDSTGNMWWSVFTGSHNKGTTLYVGQFLLVGDFLEFTDTDNTVYTAQLGGPLNRLVITGRTGMPPRNPIGYNINSNVGNMLIMQPDGNLVLFDAQQQPCWAANTQAPNANIVYNPNDLNTRAVLGSQGNVIAYNSAANMWWSAFTGTL
jgi:hypothetical protein